MRPPKSAMRLGRARACRYARRYVLGVGLGLPLILAFAACSDREAEPVVKGSDVPRPAPAPIGEPGGPLAFRSQELPFRYERGESGAKWPVEVTGGGVG